MKNPAVRRDFSFLRFLEGDALTQRGVELRKLDLALHGLLVLARPDDVRRLRRLELDKAYLGHARNVADLPFSRKRNGEVIFETPAG